MDVYLPIVAVAFTAFVSTNSDNLLLMAVVLGQSGQRRLPVFSGYLAAICVILVTGMLLGQLAEAIPDGALGYLGLLPLALGLKRLWSALQRHRQPESDEVGTTAALGFGGTIGLNLANGGDTLGVFTALLADSAAPFDYVIAATILVSAMLWFVLALAIGRNPLASRVIPAIEAWLVPVLLIAVGGYILADTATDTFVA